jgi:ATP-dependent DNA helicase RecG
VELEKDRSVILVRVPGGGGPFAYDGRAYLRHGPTTRLMPRPRLERAVMERMHASSRWENQPATGFAVKDLDRAEITRSVEEAIRRQRMDDPGTRDPHELLVGLGLIDKGQILNAAVVLFGKTERLLPNYAQCLLRLARFRGNDKTEFLDNRQEWGHAFDLLQRAQRFLRDHLPVAGRILPNVFERVDDPVYPPAALREAIANALCHRDYGAVGGAVSVAIFNDRLEIASTGILPFDLTPEDLKRPHASRPWNPLIANVFYRRGIIESWGRGTIRMAELTEAAGLTAPEIESSGGEVVVRFRPIRRAPGSGGGPELSELQRDLLGVLTQRGPASLQEIAAALKSPVPRRTLQDNLKVLQDHGLVIVEGRGRGHAGSTRARGANYNWCLPNCVRLEPLFCLRVPEE